MARLADCFSLLVLTLLLAELAHAIAFRIVHAHKHVWAKVAPTQQPHGTPIVVDDRFLYGYQRWYLSVSQDGNHAEILNDASGLLVAATATPGSKVLVVYDPDSQVCSSLASKWHFHPVHAQHHFIIRLGGSDLVWTLENNHVVLRPDRQTTDQLWDLVDDDIFKKKIGTMI